MCVVVCFASPDENNGKATSAVHLAASLSLFRKKTLLLELDSAGKAEKYLSAHLTGCNRDRVLKESALTQLDFTDCFTARSGPPSDDDPTDHDPTGHEKIKDSSDHIRKFVSEKKNAYDFIVINAPALMDAFFVTTLMISDRIIIPLRCSLREFEKLVPLISIIRSLKKGNRPLHKERLLFTKCKTGERFSDIFSKTGLSLFLPVFFHEIIPEDSFFDAAHASGKTVFEYDMMSKGAVAYLDFASELLKDIENTGSVYAR